MKNSWVGFLLVVVYVFVSDSGVMVGNKKALYDKSQPVMKNVTGKSSDKKMAISGPMRRILKGAGYNY